MIRGRLKPANRWKGCHREARAREDLWGDRLCAILASMTLPGSRMDVTCIVHPGTDSSVTRQNRRELMGCYSTVTDFARLRGWSISQPRRVAT